MKRWKRLLVLMLLSACAFALASCGNGETRKDAAAESGKAVPAVIRYTAAPAAAFGGSDSARVIAVSADREKLLITSAFELYIWDLSSGKRMPVFFSSEEDLEQLNLSVDSALAIAPNKKRLTEEQLEKMREKGRTYQDSHGLTRFENVDQIMECYPNLLQIRAECTSMGEHYALISESTNFLGTFTLDLRTGEARRIGTEQMSRVYPVLCGDRLLTGAGITDLNTGETEVPAFPDSETVPEGEEYTAPRPVTRLLPDGRVAAVVQGALNAESRETNYYLRILSAEENSWTLLGSYSMNYSASASLYITGDGKYAAVSPAYYNRQNPMILNLETREKRELDAEDLVILGEYDTGFVCYSLKNLNFVRLDAETLKQTQLRQTGDSWPEVNISIIGALETNGRDYCCQGGIVRGYFTAAAE